MSRQQKSGTVNLKVGDVIVDVLAKKASAMDIKYSYADIADFLMYGREIEFSYKGRECAITNHSKHWWFYDGVEQIEICEFENFTLLENKISGCTVDDKTVQDIFDYGLYEDVCIL